jgi:YesN/AraC family two-component response regulator
MDDSIKEFLKSLSVLYVEDEEKIRKGLERNLNILFGKVLIAEDGDTGLKKFKENSIDLIITDLKMPKLDGIEMIKEIKKIKDIPTIVITAYIDADYLVDIIDLGVKKYLLKPVVMTKLVDTIKSIYELD